MTGELRLTVVGGDRTDLIGDEVDVRGNRKMRKVRTGQVRVDV